MSGDPRIDALVIGRRGVLELHAAHCAGHRRFCRFFGPERDVLDAFALVLVQVLFDLALVVLALVYWDADFPAWRGERARKQSGFFPSMLK